MILCKRHHPGLFLSVCDTARVTNHMSSCNDTPHACRLGASVGMNTFHMHPVIMISCKARTSAATVKAQTNICTLSISLQALVRLALYSIHSLLGFILHILCAGLQLRLKLLHAAMVQY